MSIADYFTQIKKIWDDYNSLTIIPTCPCGGECQTLQSVHKIFQEQEVMQFLVGLNEAYKVVRGNILMMKPFPDMNEVYNLLLQEENQRGSHSSTQLSPESAAMHVQARMPQSVVSNANQARAKHNGWEQESMGLTL